MGNIVKKPQAWYEEYIKPRLFNLEEEPTEQLKSDPHDHKITKYGEDLRNTELPLEERAKAAQYIGMLAYTGGVSGSVLASHYIEDMIDILIMPDTPGKVRIPVLRGLSGICFINYHNQNIAKEKHLAEVLLACLDEDEADADAEPDIIIVKFWVCYLMTVVCCNNMPFVQLFQHSGGQMLEKRLEVLSGMEWFGWPHNYADIMFTLMGYQKMDQNTSETNI